MSYQFFLFVSFFFPTLCFSGNTLHRTQSLTIATKNTIVSTEFELGFFTLVNRSYLGIWYRRSQPPTYVWVANRDLPLSGLNGTLKWMGNSLVVIDEGSVPIWSANFTRDNRLKLVAAELLDNGNLILKDATNKTRWQSFDYPTDTLLPGMNLKPETPLVLWKSPRDPSSRIDSGCSFRLVTNQDRYKLLQLPEIVVETFSEAYASPLWDVLGFDRVPGMVLQPETSTYYYGGSNTSRLLVATSTLDSNKCLLEQFSWNDSSQNWNISWFAPKDKCDKWNACENFGLCNELTSPHCTYLKGGFKWRNKHEMRLGCLRTSNISCSGDVFLKIKHVILPTARYANLNPGVDIIECKRRCLANCDCMGFSVTDVEREGSSCVMWMTMLLSIRTYAEGGHDLYYRVPPIELGHQSRHKEKRIKRAIIIVCSVGGVSILVLVIILIIIFLHKKRKHSQRTGMANVVISNRAHLSVQHETQGMELPLMELETIFKATYNFSERNQLGKCGFGIVYKGILPGGQEIAAKRQLKTSGQGDDEFLNEVKMISKLQHRNLVQLHGCCVDKSEKILVYEYLENGSLYSYLFGKNPSRNLTWQMRFNIVIGIARGLQYLHQDSSLRIIHRDLKPANVLLDKDMSPKISDFGLAKIFGNDATEDITKRRPGTHGYMAPEYATEGIFSTKSDVFSFGVMLLEIICGEKNYDFCHSDHNLSLLGHVWKNWNEGKALEIIDPVIRNFPSSSAAAAAAPLESEKQVLRCIHIALVCVQDYADDRPEMATVVSLFKNEDMPIPQPQQPGNYIRRSPRIPEIKPEIKPASINEITLTELEPR